MPCATSGARLPVGMRWLLVPVLSLVVGEPSSCVTRILQTGAWPHSYPEPLLDFARDLSRVSEDGLRIRAELHARQCATAPPPKRRSPAPPPATCVRAVGGAWRRTLRGPHPARVRGSRRSRSQAAEAAAARIRDDTATIWASLRFAGRCVTPARKKFFICEGLGFCGMDGAACGTCCPAFCRPAHMTRLVGGGTGTASALRRRTRGGLTTSADVQGRKRRRRPSATPWHRGLALFAAGSRLGRAVEQLLLRGALCRCCCAWRVESRTGLLLLLRVHNDARLRGVVGRSAPPPSGAATRASGAAAKNFPGARAGPTRSRSSARRSHTGCKRCLPSWPSAKPNDTGHTERRTPNGGRRTAPTRRRARGWCRSRASACARQAILSVSSDGRLCWAAAAGRGTGVHRAAARLDSRKASS